MSNVHCLNDLRSRPDVEAGSGFWSTRRVPGNGDSARRSGEFLLMSEGRDPASLRCVDLFFPDFTWMSSILWFSFAQITVYIITVCMGSHQLQPKSDVLLRFGALYGPLIQKGEAWRFVTPMFLHATLWHILLNVYYQLRMGFPLEKRYGLPVTTLVYLLSGAGGCFFSVALAPCHLSIGASTAGFGLIGLQVAEMAIAWHVLTNKNQVVFNILLFVLLSLLLALAPGSVIDWRGHFGGFIVGFCLGLIISKSEYPPRWLKPIGQLVAGFIIAALFVACGLITFLIPLTDGGRCS